MPTLDIFNNDAFGLTSMTKAINDLPFQPGRLGKLGWFTEEGITTTSLMVERDGSTISLVPNAPRGSTGKATERTKRKAVSILTTHLPKTDAVLADEVQNVRAFGSQTDVELIQNVVNKRLLRMRRDIDTTIEWQRLGAVKGQVIDADGTSVLLDMFQTFDFSQLVKNMALTTDATKVRSEVVDVKRSIEAALGGLQYSGLRVLCSASFFDAFVDHPAVQRAWDNFQDRMMLQQDLRGSENDGSQTSGFMFANVMWEEYRGNVNGTDFIADGEAYMVPEGVPDLFATNFAPADYTETVNTIGLPYYAKQEAMRMNKGVEIEAQSNPISFCTRPNAIAKLTAA